MGAAYLLLAQWRDQASYREFRSEVRRFIARYRPSVVAIEGTGQGPALASDIRPQTGMEVVQVTPVESKVDRLRKHRQTIRAGRVQLPEGAPWCAEFLNEVTLFPYAAFDDQVDAMTQFLTWIAEHPNPKKRPPRALVAVRYNSWGGVISPSSGPTPAMQAQGVGLVGLARQHPFRR
jgi:predicted phage terminase large subunit-like protein